jgi:hypothetical protein
MRRPNVRPFCWRTEYIRPFFKHLVTKDGGSVKSYSADDIFCPIVVNVESLRIAAQSVRVMANVKLWTNRLRTKCGNAWVSMDCGHVPPTPTVDDCGAVSELTGYRRHEQGPVG